MIRPYLIWFRSISVVVILLHTGNAISQNSVNPSQHLVIATYPYADNSRIANLTPLSQYIASITDYTTEVNSYPLVHELLQALERGEADVAFMNTFGYLMLKEKSKAYEIAAALEIPSRQLNTYKSVLAIGKNIRENTLEQLLQNASDFTLVLVSPGSTSGNLVPRLRLSAMQPGYPERFFLEVQYTNNHRLALERALNGESALCAFGSDEYYSLGADTVRLKKLWESPPIPLGPVVFRKNLPGSVKDEIQKLLLTLHDQNPEAMEAIKAGWTEAKSANAYKIVDDGYYNSLLDLSVNHDVALRIIRNFAR